jgi:hypothetical protein
MSYNFAVLSGNGMSTKVGHGITDFAQNWKSLIGASGGFSNHFLSRNYTLVLLLLRLYF